MFFEMKHNEEKVSEENEEKKEAMELTQEEIERMRASRDLCK